MTATISRFESQAAVLILLRHDGDGRQILLTKRASSLRLHPGEVAFPGGMWESGDTDLWATALRESAEEVGLNRAHVTLDRQLAPSFTRHGTKVTPFVASMDADPEYLCASIDELESLSWVPLEVFVKDMRIQTDIFDLHGREYWAPVYTFRSYRIWGFTARVLVELMNVCFDCKISRRHGAPERRFDLR